MPRSCRVLFAMLVAACAAPAAVAADGKPLRVIELFTSHGCSSCPPADELLGRLIERQPELVALEYHVDYWNRLVHGADGNWIDPFSHADWTMRQREYDMANLRGRRGVYTPQMIVNGRFAAVGSDAGRIAMALDDAPLSLVDVRIDAQQGAYAVTVSGDMAVGADILLIRYQDRATTRITGGENRHRTLVNHHVVLSHEALGRLDGEQEEQRFSVAASDEGQGCAVLVQDRMMSPIFGAARCP